MAGEDDPEAMRTVLVTGGCGFIGSNFIRLLCAKADWRVVNLDKLTYAGNLENLSGIENERHRFVKGDITDRAMVDRLLEDEKPWAIVNFAAESHVDRSILDSVPFLQTNITGVQTLLESVRRHPVNRFLHVSTDEVYGDREGNEPATEEAALMPSSPYAATKAAADLLCLAYRRTYDLPLLITRSSNNYGPFQFPEKLIPLLIRNALNGSGLPVYGDGRQLRDWLYVEDNCQAILAVLEGGSVGTIYNIGTGSERTNLEVAEAICAAVAEETDLEAEKLKARIEFVTDRPGHDRRYALNTQRMQRDLNWVPLVSFEAGLRQTIRWYLAHQEWTARVTSGGYRQYYESVYLYAWEPSGR
jgi:dTDP-glucose 4,6-dehydratase